MNKISTNYKIQAITILLNEDCVLQRYYPLISVKSQLLDFLQKQGVTRKNDCVVIRDEMFINNNVLTYEQLALFRKFLALYDVSSAKIKQLDKLQLDESQRNAYEQLYLLPGVKEIRAELYYKAGIRTLQDVANMSCQELIDKCTEVIARLQLTFTPPQPKEARTHIAVSMALTL